MGLQDRFRIDELVKKGSKAIPRDKSGNITVRRVNGVEIPDGFQAPPPPPQNKKRGRKQLPVPQPDAKREWLENYKRRKQGKPVDPRLLKRKKRKPKPFGQEPIKGKTVNQRFKHELPEIEDEILNPLQESFAGETSGYLERPSYDETELKKAVDVKVDELIKPKKEKKGDFIPRKRYTDLQARYDLAQNEIKDLSDLVSQQESLIGTQTAEINSLSAQVDSIQQQLTDKQKELDALLAKYNDTLTDYQNSVIRGTKEGIERVSLTAQVRGLQAQKETLQAQLSAQQDIVKSLETQAEIQKTVSEQVVEAKEKEIEETKKGNLLDVVGDRPQYQVKGTIAWAAASSNQNRKPDIPLYYDDRKKDPRRFLSGNKIEFFNIGEESVTLNVTEEVTSGKKWLNGVPRTLTLAPSPDKGASPSVKAITFTRNGSAQKGTHKTTIKLKNATTGDELRLKTHYWQARRRRST